MILFASSLSAEPAIRTLILSGLHNHDWRSTTPVLKDLLSKAGRFDPVDVCEDPSQLDDSILSRYDVVVSNWTPYPKTERMWSEKTEDGFLDFVRKGGGFMVLHASACTFQTWPEFQKIIAFTWQEKFTSHTAYSPFRVRVEDSSHPICKGLKGFSITDELYQRMVPLAGKDYQVLCSAFASPEKSGTGQDEPVLTCTRYGKGRGVNLALGHDVPAMQTPGFKLLLLRSAEWAATGEVTIPIPPDLPDAKPWDWDKSESSVALIQEGNALWRLNVPKGGIKPFVDPLSLNGLSDLTWLSPPDHPWHRGLWFAWKEINGVNYWEEDAKTGLAQGLTDLLEWSVSTQADDSCRATLSLSYHVPGKDPVLMEKRILSFSAPYEATGYQIDWDATFTAGPEDIELKGGTAGGGYAGLSVRLAKEARDWVLIDSEGRQDAPETGGAKTTHGQRARWMDWSVKDGAGLSAGIAILDHPKNLRHPSQWHIVMEDKVPFGYFSPAPLWSEPYKLAAKESFSLRYRILIHPGGWTPEKLNAEWESFAASVPSPLRGGG